MLLGLPVFLLVGTIPKQVAQVGTCSRCVFSLGRIADADCTRREPFVCMSSEYRDPDVGTIVLTGAAFARDNDNKPRKIGEAYRDRFFSNSLRTLFVFRTRAFAPVNKPLQWI